MILRNVNGKWMLLSPADSTGTPSASSGEAPRNEERLPAGSEIPAERNDGVADENTPSENEDWGKLAEPVDDSVDEPQPTVEAKGEQPKPQTPEPGQQPAPGEQPPAPKPGEQPAPKPQEPAEPQPAAAETPEQKTAREAKEAEEAKRFEEQLAEYYKLPDDLAARLPTEPETVLPVLAAKVHQAVTRGVQQYIHQVIPQVIQQFQAVQEANQKTKTAFFSRWPSLKDHEEKVLQVAQMYKQMNPKATAQERLENVGKMVCAALGIPPDAAPGAPKPPVPPQPKPKQGFRPAAVGSSQAGNAPPSDNEYAQLAEEFLEEDRG